LHHARKTPDIIMTDQRFPKSVRLRRQSEFDRVYDGKVFAADDVLVIRARRNHRAVTRLGLSVSRKVGNAVVRNRWKRLIREAFRKQRLELPAGMDLVVRPKKGANCDYRAIERSLGRLAIRLDKNLSRQPFGKAETIRGQT
jgi:ribonuclease P protein component